MSFCTISPPTNIYIYIYIYIFTFETLFLQLLQHGYHEPVDLVYKVCCKVDTLIRFLIYLVGLEKIESKEFHLFLKKKKVLLP